jgi:response regulator RpfG family c-di-GMP phosphodiesterase/DNA-binding CsgD family transcriptional regulator
MKAPHLAGRSRRVSATGERIARAMSLSERRVADVRRAGLVYDIGVVAVPSFILGKPYVAMTEAERERYRLHPHHSRSILARVPPFEALLPAVSAHHERLDGRGYPGGLASAQISIEARILAVADRFEVLTHDTPDGPALTPEQACEMLRAEAGMALAPDVVEALLAAQAPPTGTFRPYGHSGDWPAGLTDREVEVLRLTASGHSRREVAEELVIQEGTVRSHLEHIYTKIGVSNRARATLFAMEHGLLA